MALTDQLAGVCAVRPATDDDHVDGVAPQVVASPASTEETSALLRACSEQGLAVVVRGHGSKIAWGRAPERVDVVLETTRMADLVEHSRGDLVATAGAGMPLARLQLLLGEGGHQLVVDDLAPGRGRDGVGEPAGSTLGGALATNLSGPRRMWTGAIRDLVIGVRFVRADGTVAKAGGKVVKNVAGYDLAKLLAGSYGTLAVVTELTMRLHPVPECSWSVLTRVDTDRLPAVLAEVVHSQLAPRAVEIRAAAHGGGSTLVSVLLEGTRQGVEARATDLVARLRDVGGGPVDVVDDDGDPSTAQGLETEPGGDPVLPDLGEAGRPTLLKTTARLSGIPELVATATTNGLTVSGSAGTGVLYASAPEGRAVGDVAGAIEVLRGTSIRLGGSTVVLDGAPDVKAAVESWGPVPGLDLMRRVKQEFDPARLLAPGRFVGGI
jgi:glycolate oxidase FAD binding subunit